MISIEFIPHSQQRYNTEGDWYMDGENLIIKVSNEGSGFQQKIIAVHELVEAILCRYAGITDKDVDEWDFKFKGEGEPGDDPKCPYRHQHKIATIIEEIIGEDLKIG
jgi:hypothetical protein